MHWPRVFQGDSALQIYWELTLQGGAWGALRLHHSLLCVEYYCVSEWRALLTKLEGLAPCHRLCRRTCGL